jgi:hypothetical protein
VLLSTNANVHCFSRLGQNKFAFHLSIFSGSRSQRGRWYFTPPFLNPDFVLTSRSTAFRSFAISKVCPLWTPTKRLGNVCQNRFVPTGKEGRSHTPTRNPSPWLTRIYRHHVKVRARDQGNLQACAFTPQKGPASPPMRDPSHSNDLINEVQRNAVSKAKPRSPIRTTKAPEHRQWACNSGHLWAI